jgi:hypothetical protein
MNPNPNRNQQRQRFFTPNKHADLNVAGEFDVNEVPLNPFARIVRYV